ncbi:MAG: hypothetical protein EA408_06935 [Marinilabiliales bacterium]|nr:MAG: hypothetical protein EA408_06935 [Marinilabiliales bacterium]
MKQFVRRSIIIQAVLLSGLFMQNAYSQLDQMGRLLTGGVSDAEKLAEAYLSPFTNAFGATLNAGWYNTARPHRFPGFDLTLSVNVALIPDQAKSFAPGELGLSHNTYVTGSQVTPTIAGEKGMQPSALRFTETVSGDEVTLAEINLPQGTGLGFVPAPTLQLGIGLPFGTDIIGRYIPEVGLGDIGSLGLWGIGVKHSLKQWIPVVQRLPVVNLSVMAGYTKFYTGAPLDFSPADIGAIDNTSMAVDFSGQNLDFGVGSFTANVIASADIPFITGYLGLGINSTNTTLKMTGWYPVPAVNPDNMQVEVTDASALKDPVDFKLKGDTGGIQPRLTAGFKVKLAVVHIHFDYTYANYSVVTGGIGISVR